jgi:hypothetical protein
MVQTRQIHQSLFTGREVADMLQNAHVAKLVVDGTVTNEEAAELLQAEARVMSTVTGNIKLIIDPPFPLEPIEPTTTA